MLLFLALLCGTIAALWLIRAASGPTRGTPIETALHRVTSEHIEAALSRRAMRRGVGTALTCGAFLIAAIAVTWYGPAAKPPVLEINTRSQGTACGTPIRVDPSGAVVLKTVSGEVTVPPADIVTLQPVSGCAKN
ncbi:hypothetical protein [Nocardia sp. IFM 10818]